MHYKPKSIGALHIALGGLPGHMLPKADILHCGKERRYSITSSAAC